MSVALHNNYKGQLKLLNASYMSSYTSRHREPTAGLRLIFASRLQTILHDVSDPDLQLRCTMTNTVHFILFKILSAGLEAQNPTSLVELNLAAI
ncbi:hypothetical protein LMH87_012277 [Akanthomyces muscarius]|uniref:Uncharacterized protein n=1 Tax=Akanthomyces muscarius TaxID=2231603 RepID=A0A9W8QAT3_AKAMU|nr:hypothetical protein LMH87_012277 [Akanthomyces muscarius]KAJ4151587.1 hypothetical protein LMH87_012277 [Akanthomyces muscarius]